MAKEWSNEDLLIRPPSAAWINESLDPPGSDSVGALVPRGYESYARVLHPAVRISGDAGAPEAVRWSDVARVNGAIAHSGMQWSFIRSQSRGESESIQLWTDAPPRIDSAPHAMIDAVATHISAGLSDTAACLFAFWEGNTALQMNIEDPTSTVAIGRFNYFVTEGSTQDAVKALHGLRAHYWWPKDRSWLVCSHFDFNSTYVGGSRTAIESLLRAPDVEAWPIHVSQGITANSDLLNASPPSTHSF